MLLFANAVQNGGGSVMSSLLHLMSQVNEKSFNILGTGSVGNSSSDSTGCIIRFVFMY